MAELSIETGIPPAVWAAEDDAMIATVLQVLADQSEAIRRGR